MPDLGRAVTASAKRRFARPGRRARNLCFVKCPPVGEVGHGACAPGAPDAQCFAHPRPPFRLVVRFSTQSATRFTLIASVAIATAGHSAEP